MKLISIHVAGAVDRDDAYRCSQTLVPVSTFTFAAIIMRHEVRIARTGGWSVALESVQHATAATSQKCNPKGAQIFPKSRSHLRILGATRKFHIEERQLLGAKI
jgi:hypothetical protein